MKNTTLKKRQFVVLFSITSFMCIQESHGEKIYCPATNELKQRTEGSGTYFYGETKSDRVPPIQIRTKETSKGFTRIDPKSIQFVEAVNYRDLIVCRYSAPPSYDLRLGGKLPEGVRCPYLVDRFDVRNYIDCEYNH